MEGFDRRAGEEAVRGLERMRYGLRQLLEDLAGCQMAPLEVMVVGLAEHALDRAEESGRTQGPRACGCGPSS